MMKLHPLPTGVNLYTADQVRETELAFAQTCEQGTYPLMEKAGAAAYETLRQEWPDVENILILTGKGNNGGDGFIVARLAEADGLTVTLCLFNEPDETHGDAKIAFDKLSKSRLTIATWEQVQLEDYDLVVDALLGTGISGAVREPFIDPIETINSRQLPVLSIDIPSGLNADTGEVVNCAMIADVTVTYIGYKRGLYTGESANYRGKTLLADLDIEQDCYPHQEDTIQAHDWRTVKSILLPRLPSAHKGANGHCQVIGGSKGMAGAVILASTAAARSGAGLTSTWMESGAMSLVSAQPEVMARDVEEHEIVSVINNLSPQKVMVIGPGLGRNNWGENWMSALMQSPIFKDMRKVLDADALNWLAHNPTYNDNWILTPHPGEAGRLLGKNAMEINADRFAASEQIARKYGGICVLKGAGTVITDPHNGSVVCPVGNPGMGSGGMGDVLSGIIGGLLAQGMSLFEAALLGVSVHGEAANMAAGENALYRGLLASDLFAFIPQLVNPQSDKKC